MIPGGFLIVQGRLPSSHRVAREYERGGREIEASAVRWVAAFIDEVSTEMVGEV